MSNELTYTEEVRSIQVPVVNSGQRFMKKLQIRVVRDVPSRRNVQEHWYDHCYGGNNRVGVDALEEEHFHFGQDIETIHREEVVDYDIYPPDSTDRNAYEGSYTDDIAERNDDELVKVGYEEDLNSSSTYKKSNIMPPVLCRLCNEYVPTTIRRRHIYRKHLRTPLYLCPLCPYSHYHMGNVRKHIRSHHGVYREPISNKERVEDRVHALLYSCFCDDLLLRKIEPNVLDCVRDLINVVCREEEDEESHPRLSIDTRRTDTECYRNLANDPLPDNSRLLPPTSHMHPPFSSAIFEDTVDDQTLFCPIDEQVNPKTLLLHDTHDDDDGIPHQRPTIHPLSHRHTLSVTGVTLIPTSIRKRDKVMSLHSSSHTRPKRVLIGSIVTEMSDAPVATTNKRPRQAAAVRALCCRLCGMRDIKHHERHILQHHLKQKVFFCPLCDYATTYEASSVRHHMKVRHPHHRSLEYGDARIAYMEQIQAFHVACFSDSGAPVAMDVGPPLFDKSIKAPLVKDRLVEMIVM